MRSMRCSSSAIISSIIRWRITLASAWLTRVPDVLPPLLAATPPEPGTSAGTSGAPGAGRPTTSLGPAPPRFSCASMTAAVRMRCAYSSSEKS